MISLLIIEWGRYTRNMMTISKLESDLVELASQEDASSLAEDIIAELCDPGGLPIDLRVAGILRVVAVNPNLIYYSPLRKESLNLVLERLEKTAPSVLENYNIGQKTSADEKCRILSMLEPDAMSDLMKLLDGYNGVDNLIDFRQRFLKGIKSLVIKITMWPFLDLGGDPTIVLNRCLGPAVDYSKAESEKARDTFDNSQIELEKLVSRFTNSPTKPGEVIGKLLQDICNDIKDHFEMSPFSQKAELKIVSGGRKYPFHIPDRKLLLPIEIQNVGEGIAFDVEVNLDSAQGLKSLGVPSRVSDIPPGSMIVEIPVYTGSDAISRGQVATCDFHLSWVNTDGSDEDTKITVDLEVQDHSINWDELPDSNPYSLEAVTTEENLIGRSQVLDRVVAKLVAPPIGSLYIYGQKRVGKTSLAKVALSRIEKSRNQDIICVYRDMGSIVDVDPSRTVDKLVERLAQDLRKKIPLATNIKIKTDGSLSPLIEMLEVLTESKSKIILALDEFDNLPINLFGRTNEQAAFFVGLRSVSTMDGVGVILVGGERMSLIIKGPPSVQLNKFSSFPLDRLNRETQWSDIENLIKKPSEGYLDYSKKSCELIYEYTEGNPYYTKLLCDVILQRAFKRRDSYIDEREVRSALEELFSEIDATSFSHYWEDFILEENPSRQEEKVFNRKQYLLAFGQACDINYQTSYESVSKQLKMDTDAIENFGTEFVQRGILKRQDQMLEPCIKLFGHWIANDGQEDIIINESELGFVQGLETERENLRVSLDEVENLIKGWGTYRGHSLTPERVMNYLRQFEILQDRRIVFKILENLCFVGTLEEYKLLNSAYEEMKITLKKRHGEWMRKQIRISYYGPVGKSSNAMARSFASANKFLKDEKGILRPSQLKDAIKDGVTDIVICDDFVGTGQTIREEFLDKYIDFLAPEQYIHLFVLSGTAAGIDLITNEAYRIYGDERINIRCLHELPSQPDFFDLESKVFESSEEAEQARKLMFNVGLKLEPKAPLGFGDCCALITFSRTIPNNAPPILWSESKKGDFKFQPLFPRH